MQLEIQYSQALTKPKQETVSHKSLLEAFEFKATRIDFTKDKYVAYWLLLVSVDVRYHAPGGSCRKKGNSLFQSRVTPSKLGPSVRPKPEILRPKIDNKILVYSAW